MKKKVMVFGVFDLLHKGHIHFLKQAGRLGDFLIVSVARDKNVKRIKGHQTVWSEGKRVSALQSLLIADKVMLGVLGDPLPHIRREKPDIICLGYDQASYVPIAQLKKIARVVRLKPYKPGVYKTSKLRKD